MPTLNKKLFVRLVLLMAVGVGVIFGAHALQSGRVRQALLWQAHNARENGKNEAAIQYFRQYLEFAPDDHDATLELAEMLRQRGSSPKELASVLFLYEKVVRESDQHADVRRKAVEVCLRLNRYQDAFDHAQVLLEQHPEDGELWRQVGTAQIGLTRYEDAKVSIDKAMKYQPDDPANFELMAHLHVKHLNRAPDAMAYLNRMIQSNPADPEAYLIRARYLSNAGKVRDSEADLQKLLELDPENADALLMISEMMQARGDLKAVRTTLTEALSLHQYDVRMYRALSWLELCAGNRPASVACLERGVKLLPNQTELLTPLADLLIQDGDLEKVAGILKRLETKKVSSTQVAYLKARVKMREEKWEDARSILEALRTESVNLPGLSVQVNLLLAICHANLADRPAESEALQRVLALDPSNIQARMSVGNLALNAGKLDDAIREFTHVARSAYAPIEAQMMLGSLRIARARINKASEDEWREVADYTRRLGERYPQSTEPILLATELLVTRKRYDDAVKLLQAERARRPNDVRIWTHLAEVREMAQGFQAAQETLDEAQAVLGDLVDLRLARAKLWSHSLSSKRHEVVRNLENGVDSFAEADQVRLLYGLAEQYASAQDYPSVKRLYMAIASRFPTDVPIRVALADFAIQHNDTELLAKIKEQIKALEGDQPRSLPLIEVQELVAKAKNPIDMPAVMEAKSKVEAMLKAAPGRPDATQVLGKIAEWENDLPTARQLFARAYDLDRSNLLILKNHLRLLWRTNQDVAAQRLLTDLYIDPRVSPEQFRQLFGTVASTLPDKSFSKAVTWVRKFLAEDAPAQVWIADMLWERKQRDEAVKLYHESRQLAPMLADPYAHLVFRLAQSKQLDAIDPLMADARKSLSPGAFFFLCAHTRDMVQEFAQVAWSPKFDKPEERRQLAQATLALYLAQNQRPQAMQLLQAVVDEMGARAEDVEWAKRNLALLQAIDGSPDDRRKALRFLAENKPTQQSAEERRAQVAILALASRQLDTAERKVVLKDAIASLNEIVDAPMGATTKDLYHLAQLYRISGDRAAYQSCLKRLMAQEPANLSYITSYIDDLLNEGQMQAALPEINKLQEKFAGDFRAVAVLARYHHLSNAPERVIDVTEEYIRSVEPGSNEAVLRVRRVADLLETLVQANTLDAASNQLLIRAAIEKYQACLRSHPDGIVALSGLQSLDGQTALVFDHLSRAKSTMSKRVLTSAGLAALRSGNATERHFSTVRGWLEDAITEQPQSMALRLSMGEFHTLRQDFDAAEQSYREVLKLDPNNVVALNNLAWILSPKSDAAPQAMEFIERAISITGHTGELLDTRARVLIATGKYDRAVEDLEEALNQSQTSLRYFHLAVARWKQSQPAEAIAAFRKAKSYGLNPKAIHPNDLPSFKVLEAKLEG